MIILFKNILLLKEFLACNDVLGLFTKIKRGPETSFLCTFLHDFSIKMFFIAYSINWQSFNVITLLLSQDIKQNVLKFLFGQLMMLQTIRFMLDQPLKQWLTRRKRGEDENTKIRISQELKEHFRWNKKRFSVFEGLSFG